MVRNGYNAKILCELLNSKPREINAFIRGQLPPERTQQLSLSCTRKSTLSFGVTVALAPGAIPSDVLS